MLYVVRNAAGSTFFSHQKKKEREEEKSQTGKRSCTTYKYCTRALCKSGLRFCEMPCIPAPRVFHSGGGKSPGKAMEWMAGAIKVRAAGSSANAVGD